jgi:ABC-2 type transport system permease protein
VRSTPRIAAERGVIAAAAQAFRLGAAQTLAGWPVLIGRCLFYVLLMVVLSGLWDKVAAEQVAGLARRTPVAAFVLYVGATEWITLSIPAVHLKLEDDIRGGALETHLLRPKPYLLQAIAQSCGWAFVRMLALGATGLALLAASGRPWPPAEAFVFIAVLGVFGALVGVLLYALAGLGAFWARRTLPFQLIVQKLMFVLGGLFAPVSLYPPLLRRIGEVSPFAAHLYWAGIQAIRPSVPMFLTGLAWQALWLVLLAGACAALWRAGVRKVLREGAA